eukprot:CAMPEP_0178407680 /NCGR_PEP_ID=MMETSP0689_2-20121128/19551_1 /TAXON_ID=160604 /ORGANISM="Amphidinium massartii, Strain CS-259" /LENGTH=133 /DNA_ID=CAMNT_0020028757 /DNA_START=307 /DNA_END=708 /DNA_ORIENTATION=+
MPTKNSTKNLRIVRGSETTTAADETLRPNDDTPAEVDAAALAIPPRALCTISFSASRSESTVEALVVRSDTAFQPFRMLSLQESPVLACSTLVDMRSPTEETVAVAPSDTSLHSRVLALSTPLETLSCAVAKP